MAAERRSFVYEEITMHDEKRRLRRRRINLVAATMASI